MATKITEDGEVINTVTYEPIAMAPPFFKTPWNHDRDAESDRTGLACNDKSKTQQQFAKEADINNILRKFLSTGELNLTGNPIYQDIEEEFDLQKQMVTAYEVEQTWNSLPVAVRNILKDPRTFADYVTHCLETGDLDPLRELGLANAKPPEPAITPGGATQVAAPSPDGAPSAPQTAATPPTTAT